MTWRKAVAVAPVLGVLASVAISMQVRAGGDKIAFPENYAKGVLYGTVDRADVKQYREFYATPEAVAALRKGDPIPSGTVLTMLFDPFFVGNPVGVAKVLIDDLGDPRFWNDLRVTGTEMTFGYLLGGLSGIALGIVFTRWPLAADISDPFFAGLNSLPRIALAPLLVIWFGIDIASKVVLAVTLVFFLTFFTTLSGIRNVDPALVDLARLVGASERQIFRYVMLPGAAAWVINGLKMSLPYALIGVIVGEFLVASSGLGYRLNFYSTSYNTNGTFAMLLVMMVLMMALNAMMVLLERYALRWRAEMTATIQTY